MIRGGRETRTAGPPAGISIGGGAPPGTISPIGIGPPGIGPPGIGPPGIIGIPTGIAMGMLIPGGIPIAGNFMSGTGSTFGEVRASGGFN